MRVARHVHTVWLPYVSSIIRGGGVFAVIWVCSSVARGASVSQDSIRYQNYYEASFTNQPIVIDANLAEWQPVYAVGWSSSKEKYRLSPESVLRNQLKENVVAMQLQWNTQQFYVAFTVYDSYLNTTSAADYFETDDAIEFFISTSGPNQPRYVYLTDREYQFMVNGDNEVETIRGFATPKNRDFDTPNNMDNGNRNFGWQGNVESQVAWHGTLNNNEDIDTCMVYELAIPWSVLDYAPQPGDTLFVNASVGDADPNAARVAVDWAGTRFFCYANRWFPLVLVDNQRLATMQSDSPVASSHLAWVLVALLLMPLAAFFWLAIRNKKQTEQNPTEEQDSRPDGPLRGKIDYQPISSEEGTTSEKVDQAMEIIKHRYQQSLKLASIAAELKMPERKLQEGIKQRTGHTFKSLIIRIRLEECARLLETTEAPISEIAYQLGFNDLSHFRRSFKNTFNTTPRHYRKRHHNLSS